MQARRNELELKLIVPGDFKMPPLEDPASGVASASEEEPLRLSATYYDTSGLSLMQHGITLRYRTGDETGPVWTLKLPANGDDALRDEIEFTGDPQQPPDGARKLLFAFLADCELAPVAEIKSRRRRWALSGESGEKLAELVDDRVSVLDGKKIRDRFREIEIEAESIDRKHLQRIANRMRKAGARLEQRSKASRALEALHKLKQPEAARVRPGDPAEDAVQPALAAALNRLLRYDPHARLGDAEGVHQLRVAARRMRSVIRTFKPIVDAEKMGPVVEDVRWLGQVLGDVRDLDVLEMRLAEEPQFSTEPHLASALKSRREAAVTELDRALNSQRYIDFLHRTAALIADEELTPGASEGRCREVLPDLVERMWKKLRKPARSLTLQSPDADFHRARILAKRARYSAETVSGFVQSKTKEQLKDFAQGAEAVQNVLGEHQDAAFARTTLLAIAAENPDDAGLASAVGALVASQDKQAAEKREEFFVAWKRLDRKKNTKWAR